MHQPRFNRDHLGVVQDATWLGRGSNRQDWEDRVQAHGMQAHMQNRRQYGIGSGRAQGVRAVSLLVKPRCIMHLRAVLHAVLSRTIPPYRAMVPRLLTRSALVIPMPESMRVSVLSALLGTMRMKSSGWASSTLLSVRLMYLQQQVVKHGSVSGSVHATLCMEC